VQGVVAYKNFVYETFNVLKYYDSIQKVIILEPYSLSLYLSPVCPFTFSESVIPPDRIVLEGYINGMIIALNKLAELHNITFYLDGSSSDTSGDCGIPIDKTCRIDTHYPAPNLVNTYNQIFQSEDCQNVTLSYYDTGNDMNRYTIRFYTYVHGLTTMAREKIRGFATNIGGYEPLNRTVNDACSNNNSELAWISMMDHLWKQLNNTNQYGYLVDTGRNGATRSKEMCGQWCNFFANIGFDNHSVLPHTTRIFTYFLHKFCKIIISCFCETEQEIKRDRNHVQKLLIN
jgi:hypothetical protein